jgi:hypothetical protein
MDPNFLQPAEYREITPTNPKNVKQKMISQLIFKNFSNNESTTVSDENLFL